MNIAEQKIPFWDTFLHFISGFLLIIIGIFLLYIFKDKIRVNLLFTVIISFLFTMSCALFWECFEYTSDMLFKTDMQRDRIVTTINSEYLGKENNKKIEKINNIDHTVIYDKDNNILYSIKNGYLDIGIIDTMKDILVFILGALISCVCCYLFLKYKMIL